MTVTGACLHIRAYALAYGAALIGRFVTRTILRLGQRKTTGPLAWNANGPAAGKEGATEIVLFQVPLQLVAVPTRIGVDVATDRLEVASGTDIPVGRLLDDDNLCLALARGNDLDLDVLLIGDGTHVLKWFTRTLSV